MNLSLRQYFFFFLNFWRESRRDEAQSQLAPAHQLFNPTFTFPLTFLNKCTGLSTKDCTNVGIMKLIDYKTISDVRERSAEEIEDL